MRDHAISEPVAIVTGGARGIGAATSERLSVAGHKVVVCDVLADEGMALAAKLGNALFKKLDVRVEADWKALVDELMARFGRIDVLVNNAGIRHTSAIEDITAADAEKVIGINLISPMLGIAAVTPAMKAARRGAIVNVSSVDGLSGCNSKAAYASSKWGLRGLTRVAAIELGGHNIRVNSVHPGGTDTPMATLWGLRWTRSTRRRTLFQCTGSPRRMKWRR